MSPAPFFANPLVAAIAAPPIPEAQGWKALYDERLGPMIDLAQAVPGTPPPPEMLARLAEAAGSAEACRYGAILGDADLREAYAADCARLYRGAIGAGNVAITAGCNMAFVVAMLTLARAGDKVLLPVPWYFNHKMTLDMLGVEAVPLPCRPEAGFVPDAAEAARLIDPSVKAIVLVSPNNPTGAIYPPATIHAFAALAARHAIALVLDETYRDFLPGETPPHALLADADWGGRLIQLYSFSKAYAIPGHRLGAMLASPAIIQEIGKVLDSVQISPARAGQRALVWAIEGLRAFRNEQRDELIRRAGACRAALAAMPGFRLDSAGAYFAYVAHPFAPNATAAAQRLALEAGILGLPGSYFGPGQETHIRLAFANVGSEVLAGLPGRVART